MKNLYLNDRIALGAFDFDGNMLRTDSTIFLVRKDTGSTIEIAAHELDQNPGLTKGKGAPYEWGSNIEKALMNFRDYHPDNPHGPNKLSLDIEKALKERGFSPSLESFKNIFLVPARIFAIITARGHAPDNIGRTLITINNTLLSKEEKELQYENIRNMHLKLTGVQTKISQSDALRYYFDSICAIYPVSNPHVAKFLNMTEVTSMAVRKTLAMEHFIESHSKPLLRKFDIIDPKLAIGFSDDSIGNIDEMYGYLEARHNNISGDQETYNLYFSGKQEEMEAYRALNRNVENRGDLSVIRI